MGLLGARKELGAWPANIEGQKPSFRPAGQVRVTADIGKEPEYLPSAWQHQLAAMRNSLSSLNRVPECLKPTGELLEPSEMVSHLLLNLRMPSSIATHLGRAMFMVALPACSLPLPAFPCTFQERLLRSFPSGCAVVYMEGIGLESISCRMASAQESKAHVAKGPAQRGIFQSRFT